MLSVDAVVGAKNNIQKWTYRNNCHCAASAQFYRDFSLQTAACWKRQDECGESEPKPPPAANAETKCDNQVEVKKSHKVSKLYAKCANLSFQEKSSVAPFKN